MKKALVFISVFTLLAVSCKKDNTNNNGNNNNPTGLSNNSCKISKPGASDQLITLTNVSINTDNGVFNFIGRFSVGAASTYDRVAVGFKSTPSDGEYPVMNGNSVDLTVGKAQHNTTFDGINYITSTTDNATVTVSTVNGKKKVVFENLPLNQGGTVVGGGTTLPSGSKITGVMIEP